MEEDGWMKEGFAKTPKSQGVKRMATVKQESRFRKKLKDAGSKYSINPIKHGGFDTTYSKSRAPRGNLRGHKPPSSTRPEVALHHRV
jgi:hypothetical protein